MKVHILLTLLINENFEILLRSNADMFSAIYPEYNKLLYHLNQQFNYIKFTLFFFFNVFKLKK